MRGEKCCPCRRKRVKIPLLPENVGKRSLNYLGTLERVTTSITTKTLLQVGFKPGSNRDELPSWIWKHRLLGHHGRFRRTLAKGWFLSSYELVLTNVLKDGGIGSEGACSRYRVSGVHGTNLFLGIVETDDNCTTTAAAFCPCSVEDRWCILCDDKSELLWGQSKEIVVNC